MGKLLLISIILGPIVLPARAAHIKNPQAGLRKALIWVSVFNLCYVILLRVLWHRL